MYLEANVLNGFFGLEDLDNLILGSFLTDEILELIFRLVIFRMIPDRIPLLREGAFGSFNFLGFGMWLIDFTALSY